MPIPRNPRTIRGFLQDKEYIKQERESHKFRVIRFGSSIITQILHNSHHFSYFFQTQLRIEIRN